MVSATSPRKQFAPSVDVVASTTSARGDNTANCFGLISGGRLYGDGTRIVPGPRDFVSRVEGLLADLMGVSLERVERLRKLHHALKAGRRRSLAGAR